ncbi:SUN domain-containing protein 2 isoform X3 [Hydra vulgaris]|uniref:SUN domain-containing protein 2 isoform X3 n=1 Tax=Hydra vulgaris TaxID=6087 RepID=A0ABM4C610_HYDVU
MEEDTLNTVETEGQTQLDGGGHKFLTMKDQEQMLSELKKENFDLKLRLYMTQKNSESAEGKVSEYEQQLAALLSSLEEQHQVAEKQNQELRESRTREKELLIRQKRLEERCKEQTEQIHNLSVSLSKFSASMNDITGPFHHSTPMRKTNSGHFQIQTSKDDSSMDLEYSGEKQFSSLINISHVAPMTHDKNSPNFGNDSHTNGHNGDFNTTVPITKNYYSNNYEGRHNRTEGYDNVGVVKPNNARTEVTVEFPEHSKAPLVIPKKKKGIMRVFKLCVGKSGQPISRDESMYIKREPAKVTMTTTN